MGQLLLSRKRKERHDLLYGHPRSAVSGPAYAQAVGRHTVNGSALSRPTFSSTMGVGKTKGALSIKSAQHG